MLWQCIPGDAISPAPLETDLTQMQGTIVHRFSATELEARTALCSIMADIRSRELAEEQVAAVEIALAEVVNNVVEHAYSGIPPGEIQVEFGFCSGALRIGVSDHGNPLPDGKLPEGNPADVSGPLDEMPEGGFGWFMIRTLAREIHYIRENGCNHLELTFDLIPAAGEN